jgi:hypothetical protein
MTADVDHYALAPTEQAALDRCEAVIAAGVETFVQVGNALAEIQAGKLYRQHYDTFEEYCRDRWDIGRGRAYQLVSAAKITAELSTVVDKPPTNEREARAIAKATPADRPRVIERADQLAGDGSRTAKHIEQAASEIAETELPPEFAIVQRRFAAHGWKLMRHGAWYKLSQPDGTLHNTYPTIEAHAATLEVLDRAAARQGAGALDQQSDRQAHVAKEQRDRDRISTARANIGVGNIGDARRMLSTIEVSTWERDQLLAQIARGAALAFHNDQRARMKNFSAAAMISQATFTQALDHIEALLNYVVME